MTDQEKEWRARYNYPKGCHPLLGLHVDLAEMSDKNYGEIIKIIEDYKLKRERQIRFW